MGAGLKRVASPGRFMIVEGSVRSTQVDAQQADLRDLAALCEELRPDSLYAKYANKKVFRHEKDFWATTEKTVRQHVKRMADRQVFKAVGLADKLDIPIIYARNQEAPLHISERLKLESTRKVTPVMNFHRHEDGTTYRLQLRMDRELVENLFDSQLVVLAYEPGLFVLGQSIYMLSDDFSGQLLLPFVGKRQVEIPRKMENDYFRRFILKHVARAEVNAEGFDIELTGFEINEPDAKLAEELSEDINLVETLPESRVYICAVSAFGTSSEKIVQITIPKANAERFLQRCDEVEPGKVGGALLEAINAL